MKAVLKFNLPEENVEFDLACNFQGLHNSLCEFDEHLRHKIKYENNSDELNACLQDLRSKFRQICENNKIILES